jgi:hypothetical protein
MFLHKEKEVAMFKYICVSLVILSVLIVGCDEEQYSIEMKPYEEGVERTFVFSGELSEQQRERLSALYEEQLDPCTFSGVFSESLPNDVGGAGFYLTFTSNMGGAFSYSERFRGDDDLNYPLENVQLLGDRVADFLIGWLEYELGDDPAFIVVREFCDYDLRYDVKNLLTYLWLSEILQRYGDTAAEEIKIRAKNYLLERGYLHPKEMEFFIQRFNMNTEEILQVMRRFIAEKLGYSCPHAIPDCLEFLSDSERAGASAKRYIHSTASFEAAWEAKKRDQNDPQAEPPDVEVGDFIVGELDVPLFHGSSDKIEVRLTCNCRPFSTNGAWDDQSGQIVWSSSLASDNELGNLFYASWSEPNQTFQQEHFGCVMLSDKLLSEYCIWRAALDQSHAEEWDAFVLSLSPGEHLEWQVSDFRFSDYITHANEVGAVPVDLAAKPRDLIIAGLKEAKEHDAAERGVAGQE